jgi:hypothetical protein
MIGHPASGTVTIVPKCRAATEYAALVVAPVAPVGTPRQQEKAR